MAVLNCVRLANVAGSFSGLLEERIGLLFATCTLHVDFAIERLLREPVDCVEMTRSTSLTRRATMLIPFFGSMDAEWGVAHGPCPNCMNASGNEAQSNFKGDRQTP